MSFRTESTPNLSGIGMTSQRTRERLLGRLMDQGITSMEVLDVIRSTPRHIFLDEALSHRAYEDVALPIGFNQTISQPYIVARMTEIAFLSGPLTNVLEIGTGCGYQTSILARLAKRVTTVERIKPLLDKARKNLRLLGLRNIDFRHGDGSLGTSEAALSMRLLPPQRRSKYHTNCSFSSTREVGLLFRLAAMFSSCN